MSTRSDWTTADLPSQHGKIALVTGANSGIGYETALALAMAGATVLLGGRTRAKLAAAAARIHAEVPNGGTPETVRMDLGDLASIKRAAASVVATGRPIDLLINNAGVMAIPERRTTKDGFELTFGTNHLGHFALTGHLLPALLRSATPRIVTVSAIASRWRRAELVDLASEERYAPMTAYAKSKLANVVFTQELNRRASGTGLVAVAVHPSSSNTGLQRHVSPVVKWLAGHVLERFLGQATDLAALPSLFAATAPGITGADFIGPTGARESAGTPGVVPMPAGATDPELGHRLWDVSEQLTHVRYDFAPATANS